jgi:hypothetical protein
MALQLAEIAKALSASCVVRVCVGTALFGSLGCHNRTYIGMESALMLRTGAAVIENRCTLITA